MTIKSFIIDLFCRIAAILNLGKIALSNNHLNKRESISTMEQTVVFLAKQAFQIEIAGRIDDQMKDVAKHSQAHLWPSEVVTVGVLP